MPSIRKMDTRVLDTMVGKLNVHVSDVVCLSCVSFFLVFVLRWPDGMGRYSELIYMAPVWCLTRVTRRAFFLQVWRVGQPNACSMESMHEFCLCLFETQHAALLWIFSRAVLSRVVFKGSQTELAIFQQGPDQGFVGCFLGTLVAYLEVPL